MAWEEMQIAKSLVIKLITSDIHTAVLTTQIVNEGTGSYFTQISETGN